MSIEYKALLLVFNSTYNTTEYNTIFYEFYISPFKHKFESEIVAVSIVVLNWLLVVTCTCSSFVYKYSLSGRVDQVIFLAISHVVVDSGHKINKHIVSFGAIAGLILEY